MGAALHLGLVRDHSSHKIKLISYRQMSAWLGRPHLIDQRDLSFVFPNLRLDQYADEPNHLSPFAHMALAAQLARRLASHLNGVQTARNLSANQVSVVLGEINNFIDELPPVFRIDKPDLSLDARYPYYVFQRHQLHVMVYMTMLDFLKPYLAGDPRKPRDCKDAELRNVGVDLALKLLGEARLLFDHEFPANAKFHMLVFFIFDTATILCSAIIHDTDYFLPHREQAVDAVGSALEMLHQLSLSTKIGASSYHFLFRLVQAAPVLEQYKPIGKRQRMDLRSLSTIDIATPKSAVKALSVDVGPVIDPGMKEAAAVLNPVTVSDTTTTDDLTLDFDLFLAQNPFEASDQMDMGDIEAIWDWEGLNLAGFVPMHPNPYSSGNGGY